MKMALYSLKKTNPIKYYFKIIINCMYYMGMGDIWYEVDESVVKTKTKERLYTIWRFIANGFTFIMYVNQLLSYFRTDLSAEEKDDRFQFCAGQTVGFVKIVYLYSKRDQIIKTTKRLIEGTRPIFHSLELEQKAMKKALKFIFMFALTIFVTLSSVLFANIKDHFSDGTPIGTQIVLYPKRTDRGIFPNILRYLIEYQWYHMCFMVLLQDGLYLCSLSTLEYKFAVLRLYFETLRSRFLEKRETKSVEEMEHEFKKDFIVGIKMHEDVLWCVRNVQDALRPAFNILIIQGVGLIVLCLTRMVTIERTIGNMMYILTYLVCVLAVTGFYMWTAGDITHEASFLPTSIFESGWDLTHGRKDLRVLVVLALMRSQVPVGLMAFGIVQLSYANFIMLLRCSYSCFAVMY